MDDFDDDFALEIYVKLALIFGGMLVLAWMFWPEILWLVRDVERETKAGALGDSYGSINALFSGIAMIGAVIAIFLQWRELRMQRTDLSIQRDMLREQLEEVAGQREAVEKQAQALELLANATMEQNGLLGQAHQREIELNEKKSTEELRAERISYVRHLPALRLQKINSAFQLTNEGASIFYVYAGAEKRPDRLIATCLPVGGKVEIRPTAEDQESREVKILFKTGLDQWHTETLTIPGASRPTLGRAIQPVQEFKTGPQGHDLTSFG